jgi:hypothetical protein
VQSLLSIFFYLFCLFPRPIDWWLIGRSRGEQSRLASSTRVCKNVLWKENSMHSCAQNYMYSGLTQAGTSLLSDVTAPTSQANRLSDRKSEEKEVQQAAPTAAQYTNTGYTQDQPATCINPIQALCCCECGKGKEELVRFWGLPKKPPPRSSSFSPLLPQRCSCRGPWRERPYPARPREAGRRERRKNKEKKERERERESECA